MPKLKIKIPEAQCKSDCNSTNKKLCQKSGKIKKQIKKSEKSYTPEALEQAMTAAGSSMCLNEAARTFGIPKSTLSLKMRYLIPITCKNGPSTVLTNDEEAEIVNWIMFCAERGFPIKKTHLLDCVQNYVTEKKNQENKKLKDEQLMQSKINRAKQKALKDQEFNMRREFNKKKKNLLLQKGELKLQIQNLKKVLKSTNEETVKNELCSLERKVEDLVRLIKIEEMALLQQTLRIKNETV